MTQQEERLQPAAGTSVPQLRGRLDSVLPGHGRRPDRDRIGNVVAVLLVAVAAAFSVRGFATSPGISTDEGIYTSQAWSVLHGDVTPYTYFYDHPPLGWIQLAPILYLNELTNWNDSAIIAARAGSAVALVATAVLTYVLARCLGVGKLLAAAAVVEFTFSPLTQQLLPRVFLDNVALPWTLAAFVVALAPGRRAHHWVFSGVILAVAVLSKESALLVYPALAALIAVNAAQGQRRRAVLTNAGALLAVCAAYPLWALLNGDSLVLIKAIGWQLMARQGSGSILDQESARHSVVLGWFGDDPVLIVAGLVGGAALLVLRRRHWYMGLTLLVPLVICLKPGGYLPGMFVVLAVPFLVICPAVVLTYLTDTWRRLSAVRGGLRAVPLAAAVLVLVLALVGSGMRVRGETGQADETSGELSVARWVQANMPAESTVLVDDAIFAELYVDGRDDVWSQGLLVYKLDFDAHVSTYIPAGWTEVDYVVFTPKLRQAVASASAVQARAAIANAVVIAQLGPDTGNTEVLRVTTPMPPR